MEGNWNLKGQRCGTVGPVGTVAFQNGRVHFILPKGRKGWVREEAEKEGERDRTD